MYPENNWNVLLFSQPTRNIDTSSAVVVSISHTSINMNMYFRKRQSSEFSDSVEPTVRVSSLLVGLVLRTALRNGVLGAEPVPVWRHADGCLFASWTPGVYEGSWGSLNLRDPVFSKGVMDDNKQCEAGENLTGRGCSVSYSKEINDGLVDEGIHDRNALVLSICKVYNRRGGENWTWRCEATNKKNEGPHYPFSKSKVSLLLFMLVERDESDRIVKRTKN